MEKKLTVRTTDEVIKNVKVKCAESNTTVQDYINNLIVKDLETEVDVKR